MSALKELTPEEMSKPYAKYYTMEPASPGPGMMAANGGAHGSFKGAAY